MSFQVEIRDRILYMTLNTPGSEVNIFDHRAATQVQETMESLSELGTNSKKVDAVVFRSSKPGSFINGVGLLLASVVRTQEDAFKLSAGIHNAYKSVKNCPVPTFAAIEGNCYGCGLEF